MSDFKPDYLCNKADCQGRDTYDAVVQELLMMRRLREDYIRIAAVKKTAYKEIEQLKGELRAAAANIELLRRDIKHLNFSHGELEQLREDYLVLKEIFGGTPQFKAFELAKEKLCHENIPKEPSEPTEDAYVAVVLGEPVKSVRYGSVGGGSFEEEAQDD